MNEVTDQKEMPISIGAFKKVIDQEMAKLREENLSLKIVNEQLLQNIYSLSQELEESKIVKAPSGPEVVSLEDFRK